MKEMRASTEMDIEVCWELSETYILQFKSNNFNPSWFEQEKKNCNQKEYNLYLYVFNCNQEEIYFIKQFY